MLNRILDYIWVVSSYCGIDRIKKRFLRGIELDGDDLLKFYEHKRDIRRIESRRSRDELVKLRKNNQYLSLDTDIRVKGSFLDCNFMDRFSD